ncbi:MAG TPA: hypothetical protein VHU80_23620 [Polyangiaceae bacterium]|nr:hypothetical protein [Polyangiaceae bacterium]
MFTETARSLPVDFHSTRRAFAGALDGTTKEETAEAVELTGHSGLDVHRRYIRHLAATAREDPSEILPNFDLIPDGYRAVFEFKKLLWSLVDEPAGKAETTTETLTDDDLEDDLGGGRHVRTSVGGKTGGKTAKGGVTKAATRRNEKPRVFRGFQRPPFSCAGAICRFSDPGNDEENALWVAFEEDVAVGWG